MKPLPDKDRHLSVGTTTFDEYVAEFRFPSRMRLFVSNYQQAGVAGARHWYGRLESPESDAVVTVYLTRPTLLMEREAQVKLGDRTESFGLKQEVLTAARAFAKTYGVEVYVKTWESHMEGGERVADQVETVL